MILGQIPIQWDDFLHQFLSVTPTKLSSKFKFDQDIVSYQQSLYLNCIPCMTFPVKILKLKSKRLKMICSMMFNNFENDGYANCTEILFFLKREIM